MAPDVTSAIDEIRQSFSGAKVVAEDDGSGGAFVKMSPVPLRAGKFNKKSTWIAFQIMFHYPSSHVYPHFVDSDLRLTEGPTPENQPLGLATSIGTYRDKPAIQLSQSTPRWDPTLDTAALKLMRVIEWLNR